MSRFEIRAAVRCVACSSPGPDKKKAPCRTRSAASGTERMLTFAAPPPCASPPPPPRRPCRQATPARLHRHLPGDSGTLVLRALLHALGPRLPTPPVVAAQSPLACPTSAALADVVAKLCASPTRVHPDVRLHPEVPLLALLRLVHLRVPFALAVLRRRRRSMMLASTIFPSSSAAPATPDAR